MMIYDILFTFCTAADVSTVYEHNEDYGQEKCLDAAIKNGDFEMVRKLIDLGADVLTSSSQWGSSLHYALTSGKKREER